MKIIQIQCMLFFVLWSSGVWAQSCKELVYSGSIGWNPLIMKVDDSDELTGIAIDLGNKLGEDLGLSTQFKNLPWKRMLADLRKGKVDAVLGIYWTKERSKIYHYSPVFLKNESRLFVMKDKMFDFNKLEDLKGKRGDIPRGASFGEEFDAYAKEHIRLTGVNSKENGLAKLLKGRSDFFVSDLYDVGWYLKQEGLQDKIIPLPKSIATNDVYLAMSRKSPCSSQATSISKLVERYKDDGTLAKIVNKYIGS